MTTRAQAAENALASVRAEGLEPGRLSGQRHQAVLRLGEWGRSTSYTIAYDSGSTCVDLCRVLFGGDGSYYVTAPFHPANRALAGIYTVNYAAKADMISLTEGVELATLDDDERRLKIAHHVDGFLQFWAREFAPAATAQAPRRA